MASEKKPPAAPSSSRRPPPLPPRQQSMASTVNEDAPPSYDSIYQPRSLSPEPQAKTGPWTSSDPRSSSTQSLTPSDSNPQNDRRRLLLIYIHGFMGNETSFRSFPAHVHHLLTVLLAETHVVHTKIYPRYRSKRNISFARDDFSAWLEPHESPKTDVVLLGHSMGGLLSAEVVLMPPPPPASRPLNHRILGSINFDVPFLGMHPGVVRSGLASIFKPAEETHEDHYSPEIKPMSPMSPMSDDGASIASGSTRRTDTLFLPEQADSNYNQPFTNDVILPVRKGWSNALHFINKHSGDLYNSTKQLVTSHMEFGGAMANYGELKTRYARIRALEEEDENVRKSVIPDGQTPARVRFINYYTASTGRPKKPKPPAKSADRPGSSAGKENLAPLQVGEGAAKESADAERLSVASTRTPSPRISVEEHRQDGTILKDQTPQQDEALEHENWEDAAESLTIETPMTHHEPRAISDDDEEPPTPAEAGSSSPTSTTLSHTASISTISTLPPIPDLPPAPPPLDTSYIADGDTKKLVEKEHARAVKAYEKAVKNREKAISDRAKLEQKRALKSKNDLKKAERDDLKAVQKEVKQSVKAAEKAKKDAEKEGKKQEKLQAKGKGEGKVEEKELTHSQREERRLEEERLRMEAEGRRMRGDPEPEPEKDAWSATEKRAELVSPSPPSGDDGDPPISSLEHVSTTRSTSQAEPEKPKKDRKFCTLPPKDSQGQRDPCWVRVFMENVDEVGAHCGLFFVDERYERLVGDVAERIEGWVVEEMGQRAARRGMSWGEK